eukprot:gene17183-23675_t
MAETQSLLIRNDDLKEKLFDILGGNIRKNNLAEVSLHFDGMGSADFWVKNIVVNFLTRIRQSELNQNREVRYSIKDLLKAEGKSFMGKDDSFSVQIEISRLESYLLESLSGKSVLSYFEYNEENPLESYITNQILVKLLESDKESNISPNRLTSLVTNWFQFLSEDSCIYRGDFNSHSTRFVVKDVIMKVYPEVAAILMNSMNHNYSEAGVNYIEYSVSVGDIIEFQYNEEYNSTNISISKFGAMLNLAEEDSKNIGVTEAVNKSRKYKSGNESSKESAVDVLHKTGNSQVQTELTSHLDWRQFVDNYYDEPCGQRYYFLAGFS